ncbi:MAG: S-layer homology domain-containing protein [candidate division SR1 bacterium]|nr:S-layer homology domain-containing protein [candidate division SR1 bacterium]
MAIGMRSREERLNDVVMPLFVQQYPGASISDLSGMVFGERYLIDANAHTIATAISLGKIPDTTIKTQRLQKYGCLIQYGVNAIAGPIPSTCGCKQGYMLGEDTQHHPYCVLGSSVNNGNNGTGSRQCNLGYIFSTTDFSCITETTATLDMCANLDTSISLPVDSNLNTNELQQSINWMYDNGLTSYNTLAGFMGDNYLTREQASKFFVKFANKLGKTDDAHINNKFTDIGKANSTLISYIGSAYSMGIMNGKNNKFMPSFKLTQAQAIAVIIRIIKGQQNENIKGSKRYIGYYNLANSYGMLDGLGFNYTSLDSTNILRKDVALLLYRAGKINK